MHEPEINSGLGQADLFELFRLQLKKDFESSGIGSEFTLDLPSDYETLKQLLQGRVEALIATGSPYLAGLLYRVDISEGQLSAHGRKHPDQNLAEAIAELIIRRTLQKVILKKRFST